MKLKYLLYDNYNSYKYLNKMINDELLYTSRCHGINDINDDIININNNGTNTDLLYRYDNTNESKNASINKENNTKNKNTEVKIYRFKFSDYIVNELNNFSKIHKYDTNSEYKNAWKQWLIDNNEIVNREVNRLHNIGFEGDIIDKMYKSSRYYFRKKSDEKKKPQERREYIKLDNNLLTKMDEHINQNMNTENYQPKVGFLEFCQGNKDIIKESIQQMFENDITDIKLIKDKIKKTYKNRYFNIIKQKPINK